MTSFSKGFCSDLESSFGVKDRDQIRPTKMLFGPYVISPNSYLAHSSHKEFLTENGGQWPWTNVLGHKVISEGITNLFELQIWTTISLLLRFFCSSHFTSGLLVGNTCAEKLWIKFNVNCQGQSKISVLNPCPNYLFSFLWLHLPKNTSS